MLITRWVRSAVGIGAATLLASLSASAATYFVAPNGKDADAGTADKPFLTVQKGLDVAQPGDTVHVGPGVYRQRVSFPRSGEAAKPITLEGEWGAILDGGDVFKGWEPAPEIGPGVFKNTTMPYAAWNVTWNNKTVSNYLGPHGLDSRLAGILKMPADKNAGFAGESWRIPNWWDGVEACYVAMNRQHYFRFRNGMDPDDEDVTFSPEGTVNVSACTVLVEKKHVVLRGFTVRNAYLCIRLNGAEDCVIEDNYVTTFGKAGIYVSDGSARNVIRNNECTQAYIYPDFGHAWVEPMAQRIWMNFKWCPSSDRMGIRLQGHGDDNVVTGNHVFRCFDGIVQKKGIGEGEGKFGGRSTEICNNIIELMNDDGLAPDGNEADARYHDNLLIEAGTSAFTFTGYPHTTGPIYVYRNRICALQTDIVGDSSHFKNKFSGDVKAYFYHNSFAGPGPAITLNQDWQNVPTSRNIFFLNNIFSSGSFYADAWTPQYGLGFFDYNWCGGRVLRGTPHRTGAAAGDYLVGKPNFGPNNIVAQGQLLWPDLNRVSFFLDKDGPLRGKGLDLSKPNKVMGEDVPALPGMGAGHFEGNAPDIGAIQFGREVTLAAPTELVAELVKGKVVLKWRDNSGNETGFLVERGEDGKVFTTICRVRANATSFTDEAPKVDKVFYRLRAINVKDGAWVSDYSNVATAER
jgi:parallel beta-helix repeat protein